MEISIPFLILVIAFCVLLVLHVPVAFAIGIATLMAIVAIGDIPAFMTEAQRIATGIESFTLLAIPFFILSGLIMGQGGIARRLIDFANGAVGGYRGGLSHVNVGTCMMFGSISGSATAAVSAIGGFMIPAMRERGYDRDFSASVTITSATVGLLIPPSNVMIVYSLATGGSVSVVAIFAAGILPGILMGLALMGTAGAISIRRNYGSAEGAAGLKETARRFVRALPALFMVVLILGGILGGIFTATEASAVAVLYALFVGFFVYRELKVRDLPVLLLQAGVMTAVVMLLIGTSMAMSWVLAFEGVPQDISAALLGLTDNPYLILLIITAILLAVGTFMDMTPAVLIFTPIFLPVVRDFGVDPIHFGIIMIMNLCIGLCTPPVGTALFLGCGIAGTTVSNVLRPLIPFFVTMLGVLLLTIYIEEISLFIPRLFGL